MSRQQQQLLMAWDRRYPVSAWETEWNSLAAEVMGHDNSFITRDRTWSLGHKPSREGLVSPVRVRTTAARSDRASNEGMIIRNRNSKIYHLPNGCPSYDKASLKNQVTFTSESNAVAKGYRKAGNCR